MTDAESNHYRTTLIKAGLLVKVALELSTTELRACRVLGEIARLRDAIQPDAEAEGWLPTISQRPPVNLQTAGDGVAQLAALNLTDRDIEVSLQFCESLAQMSLLETGQWGLAPMTGAMNIEHHRGLLMAARTFLAVVLPLYPEVRPVVVTPKADA